MVLDYSPLNPYLFSEYCKKKNALPTENELYIIPMVNMKVIFV